MANPIEVDFSPKLERVSQLQPAREENYAQPPGRPQRTNEREVRKIDITSVGGTRQDCGFEGVQVEDIEFAIASHVTRQDFPRAKAVTYCYYYTSSDQ